MTTTVLVPLGLLAVTATVRSVRRLWKGRKQSGHEIDASGKGLDTPGPDDGIVTRDDSRGDQHRARLGFAREG
jgi:hypothetical protein